MPIYGEQHTPPSWVLLSSMHTSQRFIEQLSAKSTGLCMRYLLTELQGALSAAVQASITTYLAGGILAPSSWHWHAPVATEGEKRMMQPQY